MWFRVAALLGRTVEELQSEMSSAEFVQWCAFYCMEPWGYEVGNWRMGMTCATTANAAGRKKPLKPSDFYPSKPKKLSPEQSKKLLQGLERKHD